MQIMEREQLQNFLPAYYIARLKCSYAGSSHCQGLKVMTSFAEFQPIAGFMSPFTPIDPQLFLIHLLCAPFSIRYADLSSPSEIFLTIRIDPVIFLFESDQEFI